MALIVEDGTGLLTAESYISVSDADAYHSSFGNTEWAGYSSSEKEVALRRATVYIDSNYSFLGHKLKLSQRLEWPRYSYADYEQWPEIDVQRACCELALRAAAGQLIEDGPSQVVLREVIGPLRTDYAWKDPEIKYPIVDRLLGKFTLNNSTTVRIGLTG